ncbi:MAG: alpha-1,2-fucosyltransferase [Prochlorococcus marinus CUG1436]|nr:alpha-1,2-fucosyltransferase [Prochlorococcus marinus CUG1436]
MGNQIFQYLASRYISKHINNLDITYSLSKSILNGNRDFELNNLLLNPLEISKQKKNDGIWTSRITKNLPLISNEKKERIKFHINLFNKLYEEVYYSSDFIDPLLKLNCYLEIVKNKKQSLKISGFWQNPSCYVNELEDYMSNFINTKNLLPKYIEPNKYITIHIRKGDYCINKETMSTYFKRFSPIEFIILSMQILSQEYKNMPIYLLSDDKSWRLKIVEILSNTINNKITCINTNNHFQDWSIVRHASINICSNSTFSYTAALLNKDNKFQKLRCIVPQWINDRETSFAKGWLKPNGFIEI